MPRCCPAYVHFLSLRPISHPAVAAALLTAAGHMAALEPTQTAGMGTEWVNICEDLHTYL